MPANNENGVQKELKLTITGKQLKKQRFTTRGSDGL
jgi:hypothetical protein